MDMLVGPFIFVGRGGGLTSEKFVYWNGAGSVLLYCWFLSGYALGM